MQLTLPFMRDANRLIAAFRTLGYSKRQDPAAGEPLREGQRDQARGRRAHARLSAFKTLPNSYEAVAAAVNQGRPIAPLRAQQPGAKSLQDSRQHADPAPAEAEAACWASCCGADEPLMNPDQPRKAMSLRDACKPTKPTPRASSCCGPTPGLITRGYQELKVRHPSETAGPRRPGGDGEPDRNG